MSEPFPQTSDRKASGISFKLQNASRQTNLKQAGGLLHRDEISDSREKKDYLLSVEGNKLQTVIPAPAAKEFIIPLIKKNQWRLQSSPDKKKDQDKKTSGECVSNREDKEAADAILKDIESGKFGTGSSRKKDEGSDSGPVIPLLLQNKPPVECSEDSLNDLEIRPEQSTMDDYEDMPIDQFGAAMLKGMGWKPGEAIGLNKKGLLEPIEYIPHPGGLGLGAMPKPPDPKKSNRIKKPGEVEKKRPMPYKDKDGRVKHIKKIGEDIPEQIPEGFFPGNYCRVVGGPHVGLYGKIIAVDEDNARVVLKLVINREDITFSQHNVKLVSKEDAINDISLRVKPSDSSEKQYGLIMLGNKKSESKPSKYSGSSSQEYRRVDYRRGDKEVREKTDRVREQKQSSHRVDRGTSRERRERKEEEDRERKKEQSRHRSKESESRKRQRETHDHLKESETKKQHSLDKDDYKRSHYSEEAVHVEQETVGRVKGSSASHKKRKAEECWLRPQLRVRIVDQQYKKGRYYNKKVVIIDVVDMTTCICQTEDEKILEGVSLEVLETVVPKSLHSLVMIVRGGANRGQLASIVEKDSSKCLATVQVLQTNEILTTDYDSICEYVGETDYL